MSFWVCDRLVACEGVSVFGSLFSRLRLFADVSVGGACATAGDSLAPLELSAMVGDFPQCAALEFGLKTRFRVKPPTVIGSLVPVGQRKQCACRAVQQRNNVPGWCCWSSRSGEKDLGVYVIEVKRDEVKSK
jgi:hypothetical protein